MHKIKLVLFLCFLIQSAYCISEEQLNTPLKVGDAFKAYELEDPHHVKHALKPETRLIIMSFEMDLSKSIHGWLEKKGADFLSKNKAEYVADITDMPGIITYLFARPKMQKYSFPILLADDDNFASQFPVEEGKFIVFEIDENKIIKNVSYFMTPEDMEKQYFLAQEETKTEASSGSASTKK